MAAALQPRERRDFCRIRLRPAALLAVTLSTSGDGSLRFRHPIAWEGAPMSTIMKISSRNLSSVRRRALVKGGMAGIIASGLAPTFARAQAKKLVMAHLNAIPESAAIAFDWQAAEVRKRSN